MTLFLFNKDFLLMTYIVCCQ